MELTAIVARISGESGLEEGEVMARIKRKQEELGGLITPEGAAHVVANEIGINLFEGASKTHELKVENVIPGMNSVDILGRVSRIYPPKEFTKKDGAKGRVCSLFLGDETGAIRVVLWDKDVALVEEGKIKEDTVLRIKGGYTRESMNGEAEIHIGNRGRVIPDPTDVKKEDIPLPEERRKRVAELKEGTQNIDLVCRVLRVDGVREFEREDKSRGRVANLVVGDETGVCRAVLWDEDAGLVEGGQIKEGSTIKIRKGYVKVRFEEPEINVGRYGKVVLNPPEAVGEVPECPPSRAPRREMKDLREGERAEARGALVEIYDNITLFDRKGGGKGMVVNGVIDDGTANMRVAFYDRMAEVLLDTNLQKVLEGIPQEVVAKRREELIGREVVAVVSVRHSAFSGRDELVVHDLDLEPDPKAIARGLLREGKGKAEE